MKKISLALHNYEDAHGRMPPWANRNAEGKPLLSWRVHILPFLKQQSLYDEFRLDEPWDSKHNRTLIKKMPDVFATDALSTRNGMTSLLEVSGDNTVFPYSRGIGIRFEEISDGHSNTITFVNATQDSATVWTKPGDLWLSDKSLLDKVIGKRTEGFLAGFADGHVSYISSETNLEGLRSLLGRNEGNITILEGEPGESGPRTVQFQKLSSEGPPGGKVYGGFGRDMGGYGGGGEFGSAQRVYGGGEFGDVRGEYGGGEFGGVRGEYGAQEQYQGELELILTNRGTVLILGKQVPVKKLGPILTAIKEAGDKTTTVGVAIRLPESTDFQHLLKLTQLCENHGFQEIRLVSKSTAKSTSNRELPVR